MARVLAPIHAVAVPFCSASASASSSTSTSCGCADSAAAELAVVFHAALPSTTTARALMPPQALASGLSRTRTIAGAAHRTCKAQHQDHALAGPFHLRAHHRMNLCAISQLECGIFTVTHGRRAGPDRRHRLTFCRTCSVCSCCTGLPTDGARILP